LGLIGYKKSLDAGLNDHLTIALSVAAQPRVLPEGLVSGVGWDVCSKPTNARLYLNPADLPILLAE
jgi:hypothetical protein